MPAPDAVQNAEPSLAESLTKIQPRFSTEFSTLVLKTFLSVPDSWEISTFKEKGRPQGRPSIIVSRTLPGNFFQKLLVDIEVRVYILHVVVIFEYFHQPDHSVGSLPLELNVVLRNHGNA